MAFTWRASVTSPTEAHGKVTYLIAVATNLSAYEDTEEEGEKGGEVPLTGQSERVLSLRRTYSQFTKLREALVKSKLAGAATLPVLPGKPLFGGAVSAAEVSKRCAAFDALLKHLGHHAALATADATCAFLCDVPTPDFGAVRAAAAAKMAEITATTGWDVVYSKDGIEVATVKEAGSNLVSLRSDLLLPLPVATAFLLYRDGSNWRLWAPDTDYETVETVPSASLEASVLHVRYRLPVVSDRDVVVYEETVAGTPQSPGAAGAWTSFAQSIEHPHCPRRRGFVRAVLKVSVTVFSSAPEGCRILSYQHADPRGSIPANVANLLTTRGHVQLRAMREHMLRLAAK